jgi:hypothetical protein
MFGMGRNSFLLFSSMSFVKMILSSVSVSLFLEVVLFVSLF